MESAKRGLRGDPGEGDGQDAGTRDTDSSPSSLQTLSAEMREAVRNANCPYPIPIFHESVTAWADQLDASAARQEERVQELEAERNKALAVLRSTGGGAIPLNLPAILLSRDAAEAKAQELGAKLNAERLEVIGAIARKEAAMRELARQEEAIRKWKAVGELYERQYQADILPQLKAAEAKILVQEEAIRQLRQWTGKLRETQPCEVCGWPRPMDIDHNICECCGFQPSYDDPATWKAQWDGGWWNKREPKAAILLAAQATILALTAEIRSLRETRQEKKGDDHARR